MSKEKFKMSTSQLKKAWKGAVEHKEEFAGGFEPEAGVYALVLTSAKMGESKSSGRLQIGWEVTFLEGEYKGKSKLFFDGLDREESLPFVIRRIESLGAEAPEDYEGLEDTLKKLVKAHPKFKGEIVTKGDFQNLRIQKLLNEAQAAELGGEDDPEASAEATEFEVGQLVQVKDEDGDEIGEGKILSIDEDDKEVTVKVDGKKQIVSFKQLSTKKKSVEKESGGASFEVGQTVKVKDDGGDPMGEGKIVAIDEDSKEATVKIDGKKHIVEFKQMAVEGKSSDDGEKTLEIEEGAVVKALDDDDDELGEGKILQIDKKKEEVVIKIEGKKHVVPFEKLRPAD